MYVEYYKLHVTEPTLYADTASSAAHLARHTEPVMTSL